MASSTPRTRRRRGWILCAIVIAFAWTIPGHVWLLQDDNPNPYLTPLAVMITLLAVSFPFLKTARFGESRMADVTLALGTMLLVSGAVIQGGEHGGDARRIAHVVHMASAILVLLPAHLYFFGHLSEALRRRPVELVRSGFTTLVIALLVIWTGAIVLVFQDLSTVALEAPHRWLAWLLLPPLVVHVRQGRRALVARVREKPRPVRRRALALTLGPAAFAIGVIGLYDRATPPRPEFREPAGAIPAATLALTNARTSHGELLAGNIHNRPWSTCGSFDSYCHVDNVNQWKRSTHNHSSNPAYLAVVERFEEERPGKRAYCASCHEPASVLIAEGGESDPLDAGVGCTICHSATPRDDVTGTASYVLRPVSAHMSRISPIIFFSFPIIIADIDIHGAEFRDPVVKSPEMCGSCHVHHIPEAVDAASPGFLVTDKVSSWREGVHGPDGAHPKACIDCHMPPIYGPIDPLTTRSHAFLSGNTGVPWLLGDDERLAENQAFLRSERLELALTCELPERMPGGTPCEIAVTSRGVGHDFPSGLRDVAEVWVELEVVDADGTPLWSAGAMDDEGRVEDPPLSYRTRFLDESGEPLVAHEFWSAAREEGRAPIAPGATDRERVHVPVGADEPGALTLRARLLHRRYNERFAREVLGVDPREVPVTELARAEIPLPVAPSTERQDLARR